MGRGRRPVIKASRETLREYLALSVHIEVSMSSRTRRSGEGRRLLSGELKGRLIALLASLVLAGCTLVGEPAMSEDESGVANMTEAVRSHIAATKQWPESDYSIEMKRAEDGNYVFWAVHKDDLAATQPGGGKSVEVHIDPKTLQVALELGFQ